MHPNARLISAFYAAFASGDHQTMAASYADDATFGDPVFPHLRADEARAMWRMFCTGDNDVAVSYAKVDADDTTGSAAWEAVYRFPATGRQVHNQVQASFTFRDGCIVEHQDHFDFYRWARMALGPVGVALGWTPIVRNQVQRQAAAQLRRFQSGEQGNPPVTSSG